MTFTWIFMMTNFQNFARLNVLHLWRPRTYTLVSHWTMHLLHRVLCCLPILLCQHLCCLDHRHIQRAWWSWTWGWHGQESKILHWFRNPGQTPRAVCALWNLRNKVRFMILQEASIVAIFLKQKKTQINLEICFYFAVMLSGNML